MCRHSWIRAGLVIGVALILADRLFAKSESPSTASVLSLDGDGWSIATDPQNIGREQKWFDSPRPEAKPTTVPSIIQMSFPAYHGVAWYWKHFKVPVNANPQGRYILRFWAVDYKADVWVNGVSVGGHENGETPFELDVTDAVKPGDENLLAVRVLNPTDDPIDGITLIETPHRNKLMKFAAGVSFNQGGIVDSVELIPAPAVRIVDMFVQPDMHTGKIPVEVTVRNTTGKATKGELSLTVSPAAGGESLNYVQWTDSLPPGDTTFEKELVERNPRLWQLDDPYLYRVSAAVKTPKLNSIDEYSHKCGFREFVFKDGYFRLNGKRIFLKSSHTVNHFPIGVAVPIEPDWLRRDLLNSKAMGFNMIRFIAGLPLHRQLDYADEIGLLVYTEPMSSWCMEYSDHFDPWYDRSMREMILRDRNHACVVIWGLLNEMWDGAVVRHAVKTLDLVRSLDRTRMVLINSGRWDYLQKSEVSLPKGMQGWGTSVGVNPSVLYNSTDRTIEAAGAAWEPGRLGLLSGMDKDDTTARWTAPADGDYEITARFIDISKKSSTVEAEIWHNDKLLFNGALNLKGQGREQHFSQRFRVEQNDAIDFRVNFGNSDWLLPYGIRGFQDDAAGLEAVIQASNGRVYNAAKDFSFEKNPSGPWSYGVNRRWVQKRPIAFNLFDHPVRDHVPAIGAVSNPGSTVWENVMDDWHYYPRVPQSAEINRMLRTMNDGRAIFLSEYGIGSGVNWMRIAQQYEQSGFPDVEDAVFAKARRDDFLADYQRWNMAEAFGRPEEFFAQSLGRMADQRILGVSALRANPRIVGHNVTGTVDQGMAGEGFTTTMFRELKPGVTDAAVDLWSPLRWCTFAEPFNLYRGGKVKLEAVLSNEDVLKPGSYPVHLLVFNIDNKIVWERSITATIPDPKVSGEQPFAVPMFSEEAAMDVPTGKYRFVVSFETVAATGGQSEFYVFDPAEMPAVKHEVVLWGEDPELSKWLAEHGIKARPFDPAVDDKRELLLVSSKPASPGGAEAFGDLAKRIARGSSAVFLVPSIFEKDKNSGGWIPLINKPTRTDPGRWLYHSDEWAKKHPIFEGLQSGGLMDYTYYQDLIPDQTWSGGDPPAQAVAGANDISWNYKSGLLVATYKLGAGEFILNTLRIRDNLGRVPQAERLLRNLLNDAGQDLDKPIAPLPQNFEAMLKIFGF